MKHTNLIYVTLCYRLYCGDAKENIHHLGKIFTKFRKRKFGNQNLLRQHLSLLNQCPKKTINKQNFCPLRYNPETQILLILLRSVFRTLSNIYKSYDLFLQKNSFIGYLTLCFCHVTHAF